MTRSVILLILLGVAAAGFPAFASNDQSKPAGPIAVGDVFPRLEAEFLTGRKAVLPDAGAGKHALVMMGFTYGSRHAVEDWAERFRKEFAANPKVTFFEVPVIGGMGRMASWFIDSGMRRGTPKELHENVITVYGNVDRWKQTMAFSKADEDAAYLALLGPDGRVQWLHRGPFTDESMAALAGVINGADSGRK